MAIAFDTVTDFDGSPSTSVSTTHTAGGSDRFVLVAVRLGGTGAGSTSLNSITYGGEAMTQIESDMSILSTENLGLWYLIAPDATSETVTASWTGTLTGNLKVTSYTGVAQSDVIDASVRVAVQTATSITMTMTVNTTNSWLGGTVRSNNALSAGSNTVIRTGSVYISCDSDSDQATGSRSMTLTQSSAEIGGIAAAFKPAAVAVTFIPQVMMF